MLLNLTRPSLWQEGLGCAIFLRNKEFGYQHQRLGHDDFECGVFVEVRVIVSYRLTRISSGREVDGISALLSSSRTSNKNAMTHNMRCFAQSPRTRRLSINSPC